MSFQTYFLDDNNDLHKVKQKGDILTFSKIPNTNSYVIIGASFVSAAIVFNLLGAITLMGLMASLGIAFALVAAPFYLNGIQVKKVNMNDYEDSLWDNEFDSHMWVSLMNA